MYRDGISEGQFSECLNRELTQIKDGIELVGAVDPHTGECIKVAFIVCTKRHNTRMFSETAPGTVRNICPGLVLDGTGGDSAVVSSVLNEFYLNSHETIQGTAKPTRYTLLFDEIGFKTSELEMLTYWSTYLYCRCNRSVGIATPAYYAHWAAFRGKLLTAGIPDAEAQLVLDDLSKEWSDDVNCSSMYFI